MDPSFAFFANVIIDGVLLGGFYASLAVGLTIAFGRLDVVNIAHPAFIVLGSYFAFAVHDLTGLDPVLLGLLSMPVFFAIGWGIYSVYHAAFETHGTDTLRGLAFFFGLMFIIEVGLIVYFGPDPRALTASYIGDSWHFGQITIATRKVVPFGVSLLVTLGLYFYLARTYSGQAMMAVAQDATALRLMGVDPVRIKRLGFGISIATAGMAGALLTIMVVNVEPAMGRNYIGHVFAIAVLGGMGSISGTLLAGFIIGIAEGLTEFYIGPSWAPAVAFGFLLLTLAVRPAGLFGR